MILIIVAFVLSFQGIDDEDEEDEEDIRDTGLAAKSKKCGLRSSYIWNLSLLILVEE